MRGTRLGLRAIEDLGIAIQSKRSQRYGGAVLRDVLRDKPTYVYVVQHRRSSGGSRKAHSTLRDQLRLGTIGKAVQIPVRLEPQVRAALSVEHYVTCYGLVRPIRGVAMLGSVVDEALEAHTIERLSPVEWSYKDQMSGGVTVPSRTPAKAAFQAATLALFPDLSDAEVSREVEDALRESRGPKMTGAERQDRLEKLERALLRRRDATRGDAGRDPHEAGPDRNIGHDI